VAEQLVSAVNEINVQLRGGGSGRTSKPPNLQN
jgi:hypothetical protein